MKDIRQFLKGYTYYILKHYSLSTNHDQESKTFFFSEVAALQDAALYKKHMPGITCRN